MKRITYDKSRFRQIMVGLDLYNNLRNLKQSFQESFADVIKKLVTWKQNSEESDISWAFVRPVKEGVKPFWESELFG